MPERAAEALILLVAVLATSCLLLVPGQGTTMVGVEVLAVGLAAWGQVLTGGLGGLYWLAAGMVFAILVALFDARVLLIEIRR